MAIPRPSASAYSSRPGGRRGLSRIHGESTLIDSIRIPALSPPAELPSNTTEVLAAGDSYNDIPMLQAADAGFFFQAPDNVLADYPQFPMAASYAELQAMLENIGVQ